MEVLMGELGELLLVKRQNRFPEITDWLYSAEKEHVDRPFRAIIATGNPRGNDDVLRIDDVKSAGNLKWKIPGNPETPRTAEAIARIIAPLLMISQHIVLVDPYFMPEVIECRDTLQAILNILMDPCQPIISKIIEIHTGIKRLVGDNSTNIQDNNAYNHLTSVFNQKLPQIIPCGMKLQVMIWKEKDRSIKHQKLHNRYILTEIAGVSIGHGLRRGDDLPGDVNEDTDDILLLTPDNHCKRRQQYSSTSLAFDIAGPSIEVVGTYNP